MSFNLNDWKIEDEEIEPLLKGVSGSQYEESMTVIFTWLLENRELAPKLRFKNTPPINEYLIKWVNAYLTGKENRPSKRRGIPSGTVPDSLIREIYSYSHRKSAELLEEIAKGHATMMTLEKIVGDLLEEYLSDELEQLGWHCCWGQTIKAVDFCQTDGRLLQIKTSDNSENSSSKGVRDNTNIMVWQRRKSRKKDEYYWDDLVRLTGHPNLSEPNFREFVKQVLSENPYCVYVNEPFNNNEGLFKRNN